MTTAWNAVLMSLASLDSTTNLARWSFAHRTYTYSFSSLLISAANPEAIWLRTVATEPRASKFDLNSWRGLP